MREAAPRAMLAGGRSYYKYVTGLGQYPKVNKAGRDFYFLFDGDGD